MRENKEARRGGRGVGETKTSNKRGGVVFVDGW